MPKWAIGYSEYERIEVEIFGPPAEEGGYDWIGARTIVLANKFRADVDMMLLACELREFRDDLERVYQNCDGVAEFTTLEEQLALKVELDRLGHARVTGHVKDLWAGNCLNFELKELDQTFLGRTLSELGEALSTL